MKKIKLSIGCFLMFIGIILLSAGNIIALGVGLYDWSHDIKLSIAAWTSFVIWIKMLGVGFISLIIGGILAKEKK